MNDLSIVIITKNAEKHLKKVLDAAQSLSDDIIVVDSMSTDSTKEICASYNVRFFEQEWMGYGKQKNFANSKSKYNWILSLDADEVLSRELINLLKHINLDSTSVYDIPFINNYCGKIIKFGRWRGESHVRLFPKDSVFWNENAVHEGLNIGKLKTIRLNHPIIHYSMDSEKEHIEKAKRYAKLGAERMAKQNKKASFVKIYLNPPFRFVMDYIISLGFLDGKLGFQIASITAKETYWKYKTLKEITQ